MGDNLDRMKKAAAKGQPQKSPEVAKLPVPKHLCRRCGQRFMEKKEIFTHDCPRPDRSPAGRDAKAGRLPDGSLYVVKWNEVAGKWQGYLELPYPGTRDTGGRIPYVMFNGEADGVFRLLSELDAKYRAWLKAKEAEVPT